MNILNIEQMGKGEYDRIMIVPKITTITNPQNITFRKFEHNEELFKKLPPYRTKTAKNTKKAIDYAEKIIFLCDEEIKKYSDEKTQKKYQKLRKCFFKYN